MASTRKLTSPDAALISGVSARLAPYCSSAQPTTICVGLSGGLDSVVLLHLAAQCRTSVDFSLSAVHVHHGLSPNADAWAQFAVEFAQSLAVPCRVEHVTLTQRRSHGVEAAARNARYAAFAQEPASVFLTAHHLGDQAETVLLNLLRGSGLAGLAAMPLARPFGQNSTLLRPLLDVPRAQLLDYARQHELTWVEDESNQQTDFDRNFLRHKVIPPAQEAFPAMAQSIYRSARHIAEAQALLDEVAANDLPLCVQGDAFALDTPLSPLRLKHALRHWLGSHDLVLDTRAFDELWRTSCDASADSQPALVWRKQAVRRYRNRLFIAAAQIEPGEVQQLAWENGATVQPAGWAGELHWQSVAENGIGEGHLRAGFELRPWRGAVTIRLRADGPAQQLKTLAQSLGIPPWQRAATPQVYLKDQLVAWPGVGVDSTFKQTEGETGWLPLWQSGSGTQV